MSLRAAINAMCKQCIYDPYAAGMGSWRQQVDACTAPNCPLYPVRPRSSAPKGGGGDESTDDSVESAMVEVFGASS